MDIAAEWADYAAGIRFEDLPREVVDCGKKLVLDTLGVMIVGSSAYGVREMANLLSEWGGKRESNIILYDHKVPTPNAVLVNATMARAHDFDTFHEEAMVHPSAPVIPACLATAERIGKVSGKDFLTAVILGMEFSLRLGMAVERSFLLTGFQTTNHVGAFGTALAAAKLLRLDVQKTVHALGITLGQVAGTLQTSIEGTVMVRIQQGLSAQSGVFSAILAERGIKGPEAVFQGKFGYFPVFQQDRYDPSKINRDWGKNFEMVRVSIKSFPCCLLTHSSVAAMLQLREEEEIVPPQVKGVQVKVNQGAFNIVCQPLEKKRNPASPQEALFSLPYTTAAALVRGHVSLEDFIDKAIQDPEVRTVAQTITPVVDPAIEKEFGRIIGPAVVEVELKDGKKKARRVDFVKGHPKKPMTLDDVEAKFNSRLPYASKKLGKKKMADLIAAVKRLETLEDVSQIVDFLK